MNLHGDKEFLKNLGSVLRRVRTAAGAAVYAAGNTVMTEAKERAPLDHGDLRGSGYVTVPEVKRTEASCEIGFGGPARDYAVRQHEDTSLNHTEGEARFLANALAHKEGEALDVMRKLMREGIKGGRPPRRKVHPTTPSENGGGDMNTPRQRGR